jgi:predicted MFS family arabinose efflux permease
MAITVADTPIRSDSEDAILTAPMLALSGLMVTSMSSFYLLLSAVPAHAAALGGDLAAGFSTGALMATTIAGEIAAPRIIARFGRRAALAAALLILAIPCFTTFSASLMLVLLSCAARGFGLGVLLVAACGLAATLAPPARRAEAMGLYGIASAIPAILCVPLGPWALAAFGPTTTAVATAALALAGLASLAALPDRAEHGGGAAHSHRLPALRDMAWPAACLTLGAIVIGTTITFLPLAHREVGTGTIMLALLIQGLASAAARAAAGRPIDRHGLQGAMIGGVALAAGAMLCLALPGAVAVLAGMALGGVAFGILQSASLAQLLNRAPPSQADGVSALWNAAYDAGLGVGGLAFGTLAATTGYATAFIASAAGLAALAVLIFRLCEARRASC